MLYVESKRRFFHIIRRFSSGIFHFRKTCSIPVCRFTSGIKYSRAVALIYKYLVLIYIILSGRAAIAKCASAYLFICFMASTNTIYCLTTDFFSGSETKIIIIANPALMPWIMPPIYSAVNKYEKRPKQKQKKARTSHHPPRKGCLTLVERFYRAHAPYSIVYGRLQMAAIICRIVRNATLCMQTYSYVRRMLIALLHFRQNSK